MKIDFTKVLNNYNGKPFIDIIKEEGLPDVKQSLTLFIATKNALLYGDKLTSTQKYERYQLIQKIDLGDADLTIEEVKTIKDSIGASYDNVWLVGVAWDMLEGKK